MANFSSNADYLDSILQLCGEPINGNSPYETRAQHYLNRVYNSIIVGGNEFNIECDEVWPWAVEPEPMVIEIQPKVTGSASVTNGSVDITFAAAISTSKVGWFVKFTGDPHYYKITKHTAGGTAAELDGNFLGTTSTSVAYELYKLEYELVPEYITIKSGNSDLVFTEATAGTNLAIGDDFGSFTPTALGTALDTLLDAAGASSYTTSYDSDTRLFTITSDGTGADNIFSILGASATDTTKIRKSMLPTLGFGNKDYTGALAYTSERALGAICKLVQPFKVDGEEYREHEIYGIDPITFQDKYPLSRLREAIPQFFTIVEERDDGYVKVRFNAYPTEAKRVYITYVANPLNLYDNTIDSPLIPRKYSQVLEYGAAAYLLREKRDARAAEYFAIAGQVLESMVKNHRKQSKRIDPNFADIIPRQDLRPFSKRKRRYGYTRDDF